MTDLDSMFEEMDRAYAARRLPRRIWDRTRCFWREWRPREIHAKLSCIRQRVTRGWDQRALWGLDHHIASTLGAQLVEMARIAHGYPPQYVEGMDGWVADLRLHGGNLLRYASTDGGDWEPHEKNEMPVEIPREDGDRIRAEAKDALHWVADWLGTLWD